MYDEKKNKEETGAGGQQAQDLYSSFEKILGILFLLQNFNVNLIILPILVPI